MNLTLLKWDSRNLLLQHMAQSVHSLLLGGEIEAPSQYLSCRVGSVEIGVISSQPSGSVQCHWLPDEQALLVGHDQSIAAIDTNSMRVRYEEPTEGVFFEFVIDEPRLQVLALHELGVVAIGRNGNIRWRFGSTDILEDWQRSKDIIRLSVMDAEPVFLDLESGSLANAGQ